MKLRENMAMKALAFIAAVAAFTATAIMGWYQLMNWDALWGGEYGYTVGTGYGYTLDYLLARDYADVRALVNLKEKQAAGWELGLTEKKDLEWLEAEFDPSVTNLRWQLLDQEEQVIYGNTQGDYRAAGSNFHWYNYTRGDGLAVVNVGWDYWNPDVYQGALNIAEYTAYFDERWRGQLADLVEIAQSQGYDSVSYAPEGPYEAAGIGLQTGEGAVTELGVDTILGDEDRYTNVLTVNTPEGKYVFAPTIRACMEANQFGFRFDPYDLTWMRVSDGAVNREQVSLVLWVDGAVRADDQYRSAVLALREWSANRERNLAATIVLAVLGILLTVYLCCGAGHKRGVDGVCLNWFHRLPGDVLLFSMSLLGMASVGIGVEVTMDAYMDAPMFIQLICIGTAVAATAALALGALVTVCARCKAHTILRDTWIWKLCGWCWKLFVICVSRLVELFGTMGRAVQAVPLVWKAVAGCMAYMLFSIITLSNYTLWPWLFVSGAAALYLCWWAYQWKIIRRGTQEIIGGNPNYQIDTRHMFPDLKGHADELNGLGRAISTAVDERVKSEHFKAELITNVSHDLKTPLTSIINYVDLLKKEDIDNPKVLEYIEVLDRKSQRLKKLTEDLVEASKASTGSLTVNWERIDWAQLTDQALAETGERLESGKLTVVRSLPGEPMWVEADGRHLWRVLDNLLTNCAKYALPGTRVYVDLRRSGDWAVLSVKNISRDPLDIPAGQLMERFVRGDESRNLEGSGLGLSIAQSLTELQNGRFDISIDGDLFKAIVTLPLAGDRPQDPIQLVL